jgi:hypothetical protein
MASDVLTEGGLTVSTVHRIPFYFYLPGSFKRDSWDPQPVAMHHICIYITSEALAAVWCHSLSPCPRTTMQYTVDSQRFDSDWDSMIQLLLEMGVRTINLEVVDSDKGPGFSPALRHVVYYVVPGC